MAVHALPTLLLLPFTIPGTAQTLDWANHPIPFEAPGGSTCSGIVHDASENLYVAGSFMASSVDFDPGPGTANLINAGSLDIFIARYDASGNYLWAKQIGGSGSDYATDLALDGSGNLYVTGAFSNTVDFDPGAGTADLTSAGEIDIFLAKYDASGNYLWAKRIGGTDTDYGNGLALDGSGNVHITGGFKNTADFDPGAGTANLSSAGEFDGFIAKYNTSGNYIFAKRISGTNDEAGGSIALDNSGNIHITGYFYQTTDFDPGAGVANLSSTGFSDIFIAKYDASGNYSWARRVGATGYDSGNKVLVDGSGNLHITGFFEGTADFDPGAGTANVSSVGGFDVFIAKYNASGNYVWAKGIGGTGRDQGYDLTLDNIGNVYITGDFRNTADFDPGAGTQNLSSAGNTDIFVAIYNVSGSYLWARNFGGTGYDAGSCITVSSDAGEINIGGKFESTVDFDQGPGTADRTASSPNGDIFIAQYAATDVLNWAKHLVPFEAPGSSVCNDIAYDASGNLYAAGSFTASTMDFDPGPGTANLMNAGSLDIFIARYDASGNYGWAKQIGGSGSDYAIDLAVDGSGNLYVTGAFSNTVDFDPGAGTADLTSVGETDIFLAKYDASGNYLWAKRIGGTGADYGSGLALDGSGNVHITGGFKNTADFDPGAGTANLSSAGEFDGFIAKYNASGNYIFAKRISGANDEAGASVALDNSGNIHLTGYFYQTTDFDPGAGVANLSSTGFSDIFIAKYNASGNYLWAKRVGAIGYDSGNKVAVDGSGNVHITGFFSGTADFNPAAGTANLNSVGDFDIFIAKYNASGNYVWANGIGGTAREQGGDLDLDGSGNVFVTGSFFNTADFDPGPGTANLISAGFTDIYLAQYDVSGNYLWARNIGGTRYDGGACIAVSSTGKIGVGGEFEDMVDFDPGAGTASRTALSPNGDLFIAQYTANQLPNGQAPVISCPANIVRANDPGQCSAIVSYSAPTSDDPQDNVALVPPSLPSGSVFPVGITAVSWEATDGSGLTARCTFQITVTDAQAFSIACPSNQTKGNDPGACSATVTYLTPTVSDNCIQPNVQPLWVSGGTMPQANGANSVSSFPKGMTTIIWKATDAAGLTKTCSFRITVNDTQAPTISCPANQAKTTDANLCSAVATYSMATFTDNCPGGSVIKLSGLNSGAAFPKGSSQVVFKATDAAGNQSQCTMTVTVTDAQLPTVTCPANIVATGTITSGVCSAMVTYTNPSASDNCALQSSYLWSGLASGSVFPEGVTTNIWKATDEGGLTATCAFTVTVGCGTAPGTMNDELGTMNKEKVFQSLSRESGTDLTTFLKLSNLDMRLMPNPATTEVQITMEGLTEIGGQFTVFDTQGRVVWQQSSIQTPTASINVSDLPSGLYQVRLQTENGVVTKGLVVNR